MFDSQRYHLSLLAEWEHSEEGGDCLWHDVIQQKHVWKLLFLTVLILHMCCLCTFVLGGSSHHSACCNMDRNLICKSIIEHCVHHISTSVTSDIKIWKKKGISVFWNTHFLWDPVTDTAATETSSSQPVLMCASHFVEEREKCKSKAENSIRPSQSCILVPDSSVNQLPFFWLHWRKQYG